MWRCRRWRASWILEGRRGNHDSPPDDSAVSDASRRRVSGVARGRSAQPPDRVSLVRPEELVWLDAHGDFNTAATSASGFLGGMPLAMLTGRGDLSMLEATGATPLADECVRLGDARDLDEPEARALAASNILHVSRLDALLATLADSAPVHLHRIAHLGRDRLDGTTG